MRIGIKNVKNLVQADEKPVSWSAENDLGSNKEIQDCTRTGEEDGGQTCELFFNFLSFSKKFPCYPIFNLSTATFHSWSPLSL